jgi:hypothetical protein
MTVAQHPFERLFTTVQATVSRRLTWRSAVLLLGAFPYVACTTNLLMPWSLRPTSSKTNAAIGIGMCLLLPLLPGLFLLSRLRKGRWWIKIPISVIVMLPIVLLWRSILSDAITCYPTGCTEDPDLLQRVPTTHGVLLVYNVPSDPLSADEIMVVQEQLMRYGLKRTRTLYYKDGGHDVSIRFIDADHVRITAQSPYADRTPLSVVRSLR